MDGVDLQVLQRRRTRLLLGGLLLVVIAVALAMTLECGGNRSSQPHAGPFHAVTDSRHLRLGRR